MLHISFHDECSFNYMEGDFFAQKLSTFLNSAILPLNPLKVNQWERNLVKFAKNIDALFIDSRKNRPSNYLKDETPEVASNHLQLWTIFWGRISNFTDGVKVHKREGIENMKTKISWTRHDFYRIVLSPLTEVQANFIILKWSQVTDWRPGHTFLPLWRGL